MNSYIHVLRIIIHFQDDDDEEITGLTAIGLYESGRRSRGASPKPRSRGPSPASLSRSRGPSPTLNSESIQRIILSLNSV